MFLCLRNHMRLLGMYKKEGDVTPLCSINDGGEDVNSLILIINKHETQFCIDPIRC